MNELGVLDRDVITADGPSEDRAGEARSDGPDRRLAEWLAELEHRIDLLEEDVALLFKAAGLAGLRERELLNKLGFSEDTLQRDHCELLEHIVVRPQQQAP